MKTCASSTRREIYIKNLLHVVHSQLRPTAELCSGERAARSIWSLGICLGNINVAEKERLRERLLNRKFVIPNDVKVLQRKNVSSAL